MALKRVARSAIVALKDGRFVAQSPEGWIVWGSDGRVVPPPGTYRISHTGMSVRKRTSTGRFVTMEGDLVTIESGEAITADYRNDGDVLMVELIPPPYFVELLQRLWGGCRGAKANRSALYPQGVHRAREGRECQSDRLGKFLSGAFARASQDHRRGHGKRFGARHNVDFLNDTVPIAGAQQARLNDVGSDCSKGAGSLSECMARRARRCAGSGGALSRTLSTAGVGA